MAFYNCIIFILLFFATILPDLNKIKKIRFFYVFISGLILFLIVALRSDKIGNDTIPYLRFYENILRLESLKHLNSRFEPGFVYFNKILCFFLPFKQGILIGSSFFIFFSYFYFIYKESKSVWLSIYLFITLRYFYSTMNTIRHDLAVSILFFAYIFLVEKKTVKFVLSVLLASSFHSIAIFFLFAYPLIYLKFNRFNIGITLAIFLFVYINFTNSIEFVISFFGKYDGYLASVYFRENLLASFFILGINISILVFMFYVIKFSVKKNNITYLKQLSNSKITESDLMLNITFIGTMISFLALKANILGRLSSLFITFIIVYIPNCLFMLKNSRERLIYTFAIMIATFTYHTIIFIFRPEWNYVIPYRFFWE
ncbi:MAG: EpsG family protein [Paludibacter sp.]|nr:EpsG family protein [Paludibacter sp.]